MSVSPSDESVPLYINVIAKILRQMRLEQTMNGGFNYALFKNKLDDSGLLPSQKGPMEQRLDVLESFMRPMTLTKKARKAVAEKTLFWKPMVQYASLPAAIRANHVHRPAS